MLSLKKTHTWLVTGGAGFIGSNLCNFLIKKNQKVICVDNLFTGKKENIIHIKNLKNFKFIKKDIRKLNYSKTFKNIDYVVHLAALGSVSRSIENPQETNSVNVDGSLNVLKLCKLINVKKFIFASSSSVYGDLKKEFKVEKDKTIPISPYGISKLTFEKYTRILVEKYQFKTVGLRFFNVFGPNQNENGSYAAVIPNWCNKILNNKIIELNGDGSTSRDFTHVENVIDGILKSCFFKQKNKFEIFNLACGKEISLNTLLKNIIKILGKKPKILKKPFREGDIKRSKADIKKAKYYLNYEVKMNFENGIKKYLNGIIK
jgi:UDP-N-acetylglucosamine 4-epimerase